MRIIRGNQNGRERFGQQTPRRWGWGTPLKKRTATRIVQLYGTAPVCQHHLRGLSNGSVTAGRGGSPHFFFPDTLEKRGVLTPTPRPHLEAVKKMIFLK